VLIICEKHLKHFERYSLINHFVNEQLPLLSNWSLHLRLWNISRRANAEALSPVR